MSKDNSLIQKTVAVRIHLTEEMLGMSSQDKDIQSTFIASKAPDAPSREQEIEAIGVHEAVEKARTIFPKNKEGVPILWDYQIKGFFKDVCGMLYRVKGSKSSALKAYRKIIDGLIFVGPREIPIHLPDGAVMGTCDRVIRISGKTGEYTALASSETVPAGTTFEFTVDLLDKSHDKALDEWLHYGAMRGFGQWRNSGKGRFTFATNH